MFLFRNSFAFLLAAALLACPNALTAASDAGWKPITYMSGTCVSKVLFTLAGPAATPQPLAADRLVRSG